MSLQSSLISSKRNSFNSFSLQPKKSVQFNINDQKIKNLNIKLLQACTSTDLLNFSNRGFSFEKLPVKNNKKDSHLQLFQLRKQQNQSQLMKAQFELSRIHKTDKLKKKQMKYERKKNQFNKSYIENYRYFLQNRENQDINDILNNQSDQQQIVKQKKMQKIKYFNQVKKHPKLFDYTLKRLDQLTGQKHKMQESIRRSALLQKVRQKHLSQSKNAQFHNNYKNIQIQDPEQIIQKQKTKFYVKKNPCLKPKVNLNNQISQNVIQIQQKIINNLICEETSKESIKKIKGKFNQLINLLQVNDRNSSKDMSYTHKQQQNNTNFPKIN